MEKKEKEQNVEENQDEKIAEAVEKPKSKFNPKILIFGLPVFVIQLIVVYFITANILIKKFDKKTNYETEGASQIELHSENAEESDTVDYSYGEHIFQIEDIVVNPANTKGEQLLLTSVAFDLPDETIQKNLEKKQILIKDLIISVLSSKSMIQLSDYSYKDTLRVEISDKVQKKFADLKINKVYFSKYIIN